MAVSGFEGFEKRLELQFSSHDPVIGIGLRELDFKSLEQVLHQVQCTVVSALGNQHFDSYVLSESSLFVYPTKIIIKTCGTTQLLKSVRPFINHARTLNLHLIALRYTRGTFIFPEAQPYPHTSFHEEVVYLEDNIPDDLCYRKASVIPSKLTSHSWHVFSAGVVEYPDDVPYTVEVCMTDLDQTLARKFFRHPNDGMNGDSAGRAMTELTGINRINPNAQICDFAFDPCGYSMNGIDGDCYSTIHVTPEDGFSYASFECVGSAYNDMADMVKKAVKVFGPGTVSVATTNAGEDMCMRIKGAVEQVGLKCRSCGIDEVPAAGKVVFQTFTSRRKRI
ncbi:putative adenosylmethionine decarboxylase [Helianthus annuus]|uniref:S-adenosylmethionine decarboxylase proenzyme n=1 Tax=Helianthus annuus TaxID=4232 RepID=A0A251U6N4_HELAN|nr:S-adenosylmethionine decarboxylase proenzyme 4 [Helianthus annuus]KAF5795701.1 putative adenosylmethionine decarboxylase [Helianthus annuus]KAJ0539169.1 putative adenosylmethionine decarboxylase [Helianthus annuus]KAJ0547248.1 putative adenosylmethionine decarboxylase [Helianthus annuus]KAJ0553819.1 putative adenosylmethionine decarboxylase [Helianthus annuus]KAJ0719478.1 putative adenosylmethionine decarboxylase [Helianthus annuus]